MKSFYLNTLITIFTLFITNNVSAQCEVNASANVTTIFCGECVELSAFGQGQGQSVFTEDFDGGAPTGWQSTSQATYTNPCSPGGVNGTTHLWMGNAASVPRQMVTTPYDFSGATAGSTICFDMLYSEQGDAAPCEGPDLSEEGVSIEFSTDGGNTWTEIDYWDPNGGNDAQLTNWNEYCVEIPPAGLTSNTQIRWNQTNDSGADYDHWGLDNINIYFNDPTYEITWDHDNYSYGVGNSGGVNPNLVCPQTTTTYSVTMSNGSSTCTDQVTINVEPRPFRVSAEQDQEVCAGECVTLDGEATVIISPAKQPTYSNSEVSPLTGLPSAQDLIDLFLPIPCVDFTGCTCPDGSTVSFGQQCPPISSATFNATLSMPINIVDLNTTTLQTGELVEVCIGDAIMATGDFTPFEISLVCPSGQSIILANPGDITGNLINGACFDLTSTNPISSGTPNYGGTWQPVEPFSNLSGCDANGEWELIFDGEFTFSQGNTDLPVGFLNGWNISFDDPEISYEGDFVWSPTTNMTDENTLNPTVCINNDENYVLSVSDTAGCETVTDTVFLTVDPNCCPLNFEPSITEPSCGTEDGEISITVLNGSGNFDYTWSGDASGSTNSLTNIGAGSYTLSVFDIDLDCTRDTTIVLSDENAPIIDNIDVSSETCLGDNDGSVTASASGGTGVLTYTWTPGNLVGATQNDLSPGDYTVTVEDENGCSVLQTVTVDAGPNCCDISVTADITNSTCGNTDGSITLTVLNGTGNYSFSWVGGTNTLNNVGSGNYSVTITDLDAAALCEIDTFFLVNDANGPTIDNASATDETCIGDNDGSVTASASGGTGVLTYTWTPGNLDGATQNDLSPGDYTVIVEDENNCTVQQTVTVEEGEACCNLEITEILVTDETCLGLEDGEATVTTTGGVQPLTYEWNGISSTEDTESGLAPGNYSLTVTDDNNCEVTQTFEVEEGVEVSIFVGNDTTLNEEESLQLTLEITNGTTGNAVWSPALGLSCTDCLDPIASPEEETVYFATYTDDLGCEATDEILIEINPEEAFCLFPDAFTPNGDNINDFFGGICERIVFLDMKVYNRWGELVFEEQGSNSLFGWDGTYKGKEANIGVYLYKVNVQFEDGSTELYMGNLSLIR